MKPLRVIIGYEKSGVIRRAFRALGHDAWSCDLEPSEDDSPFHYQCDVNKIIGKPDCGKDWDIGIFHPVCTYLTVACNGPMTHGCSLYTAKEGQRRRRQAILAFMQCAETSIPFSCVENPIGIMSTKYRKPDQIIQPFNFGEDASKSTCLWLRRLPKLIPTKYIKPRLVCAKCGGVNNYDDAFGKGCWHCGAEAALLKPRWSNQTNSGQNKLTPSDDRSDLRSRTYEGIAQAMANQWSHL
jgi:hypothetical protein